MTAVEQARVFPFAERMSRIAAYDVIRELVNTFDLMPPATVQFCPGVRGPLTVYVDTDDERTAWLRVLGVGSTTIAGREVAVLSVQAARERLAANTCDSCGGDLVHQFGCPVAVAAIPVVVLAPSGVVHYRADFGAPCGLWNGLTDDFTDDPEAVTCGPCHAWLADHSAVYVPVPMPTGDRANADECARLNGDGRLHVIPDGVHPRGRDIERHEQHPPVPIVDVLTFDPDLCDGGRGDAEIARIGVPIDLQRSFGEAPERLAGWRPEVTPADAAAERFAHALVVTSGGE